MNWGTPDDIKNMLDYSNQDYNLSYSNYEVIIKFDGIDKNVIYKNKYLEGRITLNSDGSCEVKFMAIARYNQLITQVSKFLTVYNSHSELSRMSLKNITGYKSVCILKFSDQEKNLKICDIVRRLNFLDIKYDTVTQEEYMEIHILNSDCKISFFKEPFDVSRAIFIFIESSSVIDYKYKLHMMANIMGILMNDQNMFSDSEFTTVLVL